MNVFLVSFQIYFRRHNRKGTFKLDGLGYFRPFHLGCGGFTSVNFGSINDDDLTSYSIQELQVRYSISTCLPICIDVCLSVCQSINVDDLTSYSIQELQVR